MRYIACVLFVFALAFTFVAGGAGLAQAEVVEVEGAKFNLKLSMDENLQSHKGKTVTVILMSGKELTGKVKAVERDYLHLEALAGKEFYDALVRIDHISAVVAKLRLFK